MTAILDLLAPEYAEYAKKFDCSEDEAKKVVIKMTMRGAMFGNYEKEIAVLDKGPYSNEPEIWFDNKFREILVELRAM